jgi:nucleoside-diphosphate-sugar epimerase
MAEQPMREDALLTGTLEPTNEPYAIAKIAGIKLCESYLSDRIEWFSWWRSGQLLDHARP